MQVSGRMYIGMFKVEKLSSAGVLGRDRRM